MRTGAWPGKRVAGLGYRMAGRNETRVAVFLGGRSPEHDVSVITGLQALKAIDQERFVAFPVYVNPRGAWFVGEALAERRNYLPDARIAGELTEVSLSLGEAGSRRSRAQAQRVVRPPRGDRIRCRPPGLSRARRRGRADAGPLRDRQPALHRNAHAGLRRLHGQGRDQAPACAASTSRCCRTPSCRAAAGGLPSADSLKALLSGIGFPVHRQAGASRQQHRGRQGRRHLEEVRALLPMIFRLDTQALIEPFVPNLVEYNLAVMRIGGEGADLGDRAAEARRGAAGFPPEIPVGRRRQVRHQGRCREQPGDAVA